ncbi:J domain-containing protein [Sphingomicrobium marinum]|uniref:J domain-containing protein n=1 Tax=Sphingomicrobium marinum TaxID=1227950 RepID=UPI00224025EC|nr:J domain-containing protein [Sphingomicrobium marinum]
MHSHYHTLGIPPTASAREIREAYRAKMRVHHPDRGAVDGGAQAAEINAAYKCLSNPTERRRYDKQNGYSEEPIFHFHRPKRRNAHSIHPNAEAAAREEMRRRQSKGLPIKWIVMLSVLLTIPLIYGIWTNGY